MSTALYTLDNSPQFEWLELSDISSTNDFLRHYLPKEKKEMVLVTTDFQENGRGQTGNHWESERGKNLLFSLLLHPKSIKANRQFILSQAIALSIKEALSPFTGGVVIKWPNDIYWQHKKMGGILIENSLQGAYVEQCIIGVGLNINQQLFKSDAPNPISLCKVVGEEVEIRFVLADIIHRFKGYYASIQRGETAGIANAYEQSLYNKEGEHAYIDEGGRFEASIERVEPTGHLQLRDTSGKIRRYAFKEVRHIIPIERNNSIEL